MNIKNFLEFSKPFINATKMVFETMISTQIEHLKPELKNDSRMFGDISAIIGMSGTKKIEEASSRFRGLMVLSFSNETYIAIANRMLQEDYKEFNSEIEDVGAEIVNIIMGNAKKDLNGLGIFPEMASPSTIRGTNHTITSLDKSYTIVIPFQCELGEFKMEICYVEVP
ncbi:MAG: chemotaxis protein CheX [Bacteriovoracaceae bacterium]